VGADWEQAGDLFPNAKECHRTPCAPRADLPVDGRDEQTLRRFVLRIKQLAVGPDRNVSGLARAQLQPAWRRREIPLITTMATPQSEDQGRPGEEEGRHGEYVSTRPRAGVGPAGAVEADVLAGVIPVGWAPQTLTTDASLVNV